MAWFDELDEQTQQQWQSRFAQERVDFSASVEATLTDSSLQEKQWAEETDSSVQVSKGMMLIPPRLSLQSRPMPVVRPGAFSQPAAQPEMPSTPGPGARPVPSTQSANVLVRLAQRITTSLASFGASMQSPAYTVQTGEIQSFAQTGEAWAIPSAIHTTAKQSEPHFSTMTDAVPVSRPAATPQSVQSKQRLAGRTAKVRLQTAPALEDVYKLAAMKEPLTSNSGKDEMDITTNVHLSTVDRTERRTDGASGRSLSGSGVFEKGCSDMMVANSHVTASSVVVVMLASDPGPVVVQYISLQPQVGFTVHLSAPTKMRTPFNYVILLGKIF